MQLPNNATDILVATRHAATIDYLIELGVITAEQGAKAVPSVTIDDVRGKWVIGVLPIHLIAECALFTSLPMFVPDELRGVELTIEQVRKYAQPIAHYTAKRVNL